MKKARQPRTKKPTAREFKHVLAAEKYVDEVISGKIPACKWVKLACERHIKDRAASITKAFPYKFNPEKGDQPCRFFEKLPHVKGKWGRIDPVTKQRQTLKLEPWQSFIFVSIFGWERKDNGKRRFRKARIYVPRKNGKSFIASAVGWWMFALDGEPGAEVYAGATSEAQAWKVFEPARQMAKIEPRLPKSKGVTVNAQTLVKSDGSIFKPIIGKPGDGDSPHCAITDEYHEHATSDQLDTMETGMGAREQPLSLVISTAGSNAAGPCREDWRNCEMILSGTEGFQDETTFAIIYGIDAGDRWDCEESLIKANPNWGVSIEPVAMLADLKAAQQRASRQSAFKTKHLNEWVSVKQAYFNSTEWAKLAHQKITREDYKEFPCYLAGDLASKHDLVALMQLFCLPDKRFALFGKYYIPEATLNLPENQHYRNWHIAGWLETAGEEVTDLDHFKDDVLQLCKDFDVIEMPSDPNRAWGVFPALEKEGVPIVEYRNTVLMMSEPMKELDALIRSGRIIHNGDPVLAWAIANTTGRVDAKDNVYPNKESVSNKIDPVVATIMAIGRAMTRDPDQGGEPFFAF
jgi:phage terminase large subunit-like protein